MTFNKKKYNHIIYFLIVMFLILYQKNVQMFDQHFVLCKRALSEAI